jgi:glycine cleavage system aminomethyltransferase T/glycine/D-amino acid oxidase-like deaminating enzyme
MTNPVPASAEIIVIGGGIIGCSTAYHLAKLGKRDVVVLERSKVGSGTTWHSAAMVRRLRSTPSLTALTKYSVELYKSLEEETGLASGWIGCGSLSIATNKDRLTHIRRQASLAGAMDIEVKEIGPEEIQKLWPFANTSDIIAGILSPGDGRVSPTDVLAALVRGAKRAGVRFIEDVPVTGFDAVNGRVKGVHTTSGSVATECAVLCGGLWSREVGALAGVSVPLYACEHYALITKAFDGIYPGMPILGDHDGHMYIRDEGGGLMVGCFEPRPKPIDISELPKDFSFGLLKEDWEQFEQIMPGAIHRIPPLEKAEVRMLLNGPESFTLDNSFLLGEAPELRGFYLGCGMNSVGMASGGGAGRALAEWIVQGEPTMDLWSVDIRRFGRIRNNLSVLRERSAENLSLHYALSQPGREFVTGRNLRQTPLHSRLAARGAFFGERAGWERASWFQPADENAVANELTFARPSWYDRVALEHRAAREAVALLDQSTFGKILVQGRDASAFLERVCAARTSVPASQLVYTPILNARGGYESDVVVQRHSDTVFMVITGAAQPTHDIDLLRSRIKRDEFVVVTDITSALATLSVMGPKSRDLLRKLTPANLDNESFPYMTQKEIELAGSVVRAARISYVGELGWELYVPSEAANHVYDALFAAGTEFGLTNAGTFALGSLRLEKGFCSWGHDIGPDDTPLHAGLGFTTKLNTDIDFIGRAALEKQRERGIDRRRVLLKLDDPEIQLLGTEPIIADGEIVGQITSAGYGHTVGAAIAMGYARVGRRKPSDLVDQAKWEIEVALQRFPAKATLKPLHDPQGVRLRA